MSTKKSNKKKHNKKLSFAQKLASQLNRLKVGTVDIDSASDKSGTWVDIKAKNTSICFVFDFKGQNIESVSIYQDKVTTEQVKVWP